MPCISMSRLRVFMSGLPFGCLVLYGFMTIGGCASSQVDVVTETIQPVPASENAALRYWEAWWELGPDAFPGFFDRILLIDTKTGKPIDQGEPEPLSDRGIKMLIAATEMPRCDFGLDLSAAVRDDLTGMSSGDHYWLLLKSFGLLLEQAETQLDRSDPEQAARLYRAALYMIDHASQQPELVTLGIPKAFMDLIDEIKKSNGEFPRSAREILAEATSRFDTEDPFRIVQGLHSLMNVSAESIRKGEAENEEGFDPDDLDRIAQLIHEFMDADPAQDDRLWKQLGMNKQNPARKGFEPFIRELREQEAKAIEALTWLRDWSSN